MISYFEIWKECGRGEEGEGGRIEGERKKRVKKYNKLYIYNILVFNSEDSLECHKSGFI